MFVWYWAEILANQKLPNQSQTHPQVCARREYPHTEEPQKKNLRRGGKTQTHAHPAHIEKATAKRDRRRRLFSNHQFLRFLETIQASK